MATKQAINRSYSKLAQIYNFFQEDYPNEHMMQTLLNKEGDINFNIPPNSPIRFIKSNLIGCTALHIAALKNDPLIFDSLLRIDADFIAQDCEGRTALHCLIEQSHWNRELIDVIFSTHLSLGDPTNPCDKDGLSHFYIACWHNRVDAVEFFLNNGIPVDLPVDNNAKKFYAGYSPLHFAAKGMALTIIGVLLKYNANMDVKDARGLTPFHILLEEKIAAMNCYGSSTKDMKMSCEMLAAMDNALNLLLNSNEVDDIGLTQLHIACTQRDPSVAEYFLEQNLDIDQQVNMNSPIYPGYTALHFAVHCNLDTVKMLLRKKANCEVRDANGVTPMDLILERCKYEDLPMIMQKWKYVTFSDKQTRLFDFIGAVGETKPLEYYLQHINDITTTLSGVEVLQWTGRTLLHFAVMFCKNIDAIEVCMKRGMNVLIDTKDCHGITPIHLAFRMKKLDILRSLIKCAGEYFSNHVDNEGLSYLHIACALQEDDFFKRIRAVDNKKAVYHGKSTYGLITPGSTVLHVAIANGNFTIIEKLLEWNLDFEATDAKGLTPLHRFFLLTEYTKIICRFLLWNRTLSDCLLEKVGLTRLHLVIFSGEYNVFHKYVNEKNIEAVVKCSDPSSFFYPYDGCTPLHLAIRKDAGVEQVIKLMDCGADLLAKNHQGDTPLYDVLTGYSNYTMKQEIVNVLKIDDELRRRMEEMSGITMLHIACYMINRDEVSRLLSERAEVNARVRFDCNIWPGCTPLHLLLKSLENKEVNYDICCILTMLLAAGADVAALDGNNETPIHLSLRKFSIQCVDKVVMPIIENLRVFNINPVDRSGMSHFHIACFVNRVDVVKSFLENGVDVDQPIDFFAKNLAGETPLHLAVDHRTDTVSRLECKREIAQLLLKYGADVKAEDSFGQTAFHKAVRLIGHLDILNDFVKSGADINARNIFEQTPLELLLLRSKNVSANKIEFFKTYACRLNDSNPLTEKGYISMLISQNYHIDIDVIAECFEVMVNAADSFEPDNMGRYLIHNSVTTNNPIQVIFSYSELIKLSQSVGMDIDLQDKQGKTALHLAAQFGNHMAVKDLLNNGADINILDVKNKTALDYAIEYYYDEKACPNEQCHRRVLEVMLPHIGKLQRLKLEIRRSNVDKKEEAFNTIFAEKLSFVSNYHEEMNSIALAISSLRLSIDDESRLLMDFLSETGRGLTSYPFMSEACRDKVDKYFDEYKDTFQDVCALQYRKAVKRVKLVELAGNIVSAIAGSTLSVVCIKQIFQYLKNTELENLIKAAAL